MRKLYPCVSEMIGPDPHHQKRLKVIGRWVEIGEKGVEVYPDERYVKQALEAYGMQECKPATSPATKHNEETHDDRRGLLIRRLLEENRPMGEKDKEEESKLRGTPLEEAEATTFRSVAALINFIAPDRADIQYAVKEFLRAMSEPGELDLARLKRILRDLKGKPKVSLKFPFGPAEDTIQVYVDADFAGCQTSRKSTCGGIVVWRGGVIKTWSKTKSTIALSTGEAELGAIVRGVAEGEGIVSLLRDFGLSARICLKSDASAAVGITKRVGLGKVRHLAVSDLWVQQRVQKGDVIIEKVAGKVNPADLLTKALDWPRILELITQMGLKVESTGQ